MKFFAGFVLCSFMAITGLTAGTEVTMEGTYIWEREDGPLPGPVKAVFSPKEDGDWDVKFYFIYREEDHVYSGTAKGNLDNGNLEGEVKNERKNRTFTFKGVSKDGTFTGEHQEIGGRRGDQETGTITLTKK